MNDPHLLDGRHVLPRTLDRRHERTIWFKQPFERFEELSAPLQAADPSVDDDGIVLRAEEVEEVLELLRRDGAKFYSGIIQR